jgi:hypothetical protein
LFIFAISVIILDNCNVGMFGYMFVMSNEHNLMLSFILTLFKSVISSAELRTLNVKGNWNMLLKRLVKNRAIL